MREPRYVRSWRSDGSISFAMYRVNSTHLASERGQGNETGGAERRFFEEVYSKYAIKPENKRSDGELKGYRRIVQRFLRFLIVRTINC